jgi:hypothetical protein
MDKPNKKGAVYVTLDKDVAAALDKLVARRRADGDRRETRASAAGAMVARCLKAEGLLK